MSLTGLKKIDSIIFDLDGTLWDATPTCAAAWNKAITKLDYPAIADAAMIRSFAGLPISIILERYFPSIPVSDHHSVIELYKANELELIPLHGGTLFPQVKEVLEILQKRYSLYIVSNCLAGYIENFMSFHKLTPFFKDIECPGNTGLSKKENIQLVCRRNQLMHPVYVGDTIWDYEAASNAHIPFIHATYGFGKVAHATWNITCFNDLLVLADIKSIIKTH